MADKESLIKQIGLLADELEITIEEDLTKLKHAELTVKVSELKDAVKAKRETEESISEKREESGEKPPYYVADGRSLTTAKRGIQGPGKEILVKDFATGQEALDGWVEQGYVIKS